MSRPTLSVVMPNYNHARFLPESVRAILDQSHRPEEVIVVDDGSTDNSIEVLTALAEQDPLLRVLRNDRNRGVMCTVNYGVQQAVGDYVSIQPCDDIISPGLFEKSMNLLAHHPEAGLCSSLTGVINEKGEYQGLLYMPFSCRTECFLAPMKALAILRRHGNWLHGNTVVYRRCALIEAGGFIQQLGPDADAFINQVLALKHGACFIPEPLAMVRKMKGTFSENGSTDPDSVLALVDNVQQCMPSSYRDLFPPDYVDDWAKARVYETCKNIMMASQTTQVASFRRLFRSQSLIDRAFFKALQAAISAQRFATQVYLFARFRRGHLWQALRRKRNLFADPRR